ncbi:MAG TPA: TrkH family potassium uptake protein [Gaiellaceae bacterium]|nr:TrkH family potassium uptake protein [Gaiellaceae bacterium]
MTTLVRARGPALGVDVAAALNLVGELVRWLSLAFLFPTAIALGYGEPVWPFLAAGAVAAAVGFALERVTQGAERVGPREGFLVISVLWALVAALGALPYLFAGEEQLANPLDAYFESMSGFSGTSASVLSNVEGLNQSLAMWRQLTAWVGGLGILVLGLAVLPRLRVGGRQLFELDAPGPDLDPLAVTIRETARRFVILYVGLTFLEIAALVLVGWTGLDEEMGLFEAVAHSFGTLATAGFSTENESVSAFGPATQWVLIAFMFLAGTNFALMYRAFIRGRPVSFARDDEFRLYVALLTLGSALLVVELLSEGLARGEEAVRHGVFQTVSTMTTTGFASVDYNEWTFPAAVTIVALMFFGGSAGSTSGSLNVVRHVLIGRILRRELELAVHPELIRPVRLNGRVVEDRALRGVIAFVLLYVGCFALGAFGLMLDAARTDLELTPFDAVAAAATTIGNVGPGFGIAGPLGSFAEYGAPSKVILIVLMWLGRLEIIPVAVLLMRRYWRV